MARRAKRRVCVRVYVYDKLVGFRGLLFGFKD